MAVILFGVAIILTNSFEPAWAQDSTLANDLLTNPIFSEDSRVMTFLLFVIGVAIYALFVWYFYRFISKRDLFPKIFYPISGGRTASIPKLVGLAAAYTVSFPLVIFAWFIVLSFFVFFISKEMPFEVATFVSMTIIAVVRILSYYREDAAKEVAKLIPYALLAFFLTSVALFADPTFFTEKEFSSIPIQLVDNFDRLIAAIAVISIFEYSFRIVFIVKRKIWPVADKQLEDTIESEVEAITKAHFQKMEQKEKELEMKIEKMMKKLKDSEKSL